MDGDGYDTDASNNWWGTVDTTQIDSDIYDYYDDFELGKLSYLPIATSVIGEAGAP